MSSVCLILDYFGLVCQMVLSIAKSIGMLKISFSI